MDVSPAPILAMWCAGMAGGAAIVAWWRIVGPGFAWLSAGVVAGVGVGVATFGNDVAGVGGVVLAVLAGLLARRPFAAASLFAASALTFLGAALLDSPWVPAITGSVLLGGMTTEMMLGHWYLVDPRLPRWALQRLVVAAAAGLVADVASSVVAGALDWAPDDVVLGWAFVVMAVTTALLTVGVWFALREPNYTGVMAATGLSYLAMLTMFGVVVLGRLLPG